jgi:hypothetical protein
MAKKSDSRPNSIVRLGEQDLIRESDEAREDTVSRAVRDLGVRRSTSAKVLAMPSPVAAADSDPVEQLRPADVVGLDPEDVYARPPTGWSAARPWLLAVVLATAVGAALLFLLLADDRHPDASVAMREIALRQAGILRIESTWDASGAPTYAIKNASDDTLAAAAAQLALIDGAFNLSLAFSAVKQLEPLQTLGNLKRLDLSHSGVSSLQALRELNLKELRLRQTAVTDLAPLAVMTDLIALDLGMTRVIDIRALRGLHNLEQLDLTDTPVANAAPLTELGDLRALSVAGTQIPDLRPLANLAKLERAQVSAKTAAELEPLKQLKELRCLELVGPPIRGLELVIEFPRVHSTDCGTPAVAKLG